MVRRDTVPVTPSWSACGASVRGASHLRDGLPNQDAIALWTSDDPASPVAIVAIADGHGSPRHFRSALGARFAVDESLAVLRDLGLGLDRADPAARSHLAAVDLPRRIVEGWTVRTRAHLAAHPLSDAELRAVADGEGQAAAQDVAADPLLAYGATLLAALVTGQCVVLTQLGDGDILAVEVDGSTTRPLPTDERLTGNLTTSICRAGAEDDFRSVVLPRRATQAAYFLSTDGYANSFKSDADFLQVGGDFVAMIGKDGMVAVERQLDAILRDASTVGSGDDITLGIVQCVDGSRSARELASRVGVEPAAATTAPPPSPPVAPLADLRLAEAQSHVRRLRLIALAALVVALVAVGWTWRERLPAWLKADRPAIADGKPRIDLPKTGQPPKIEHPVPAKPDFGDAPATSPAGLPAVSPGAPKAASDSGVVAPPPPRIDDVRAKRVADGVRVTATVAFDGPRDPSCRFEATVWTANDRHESGESPLAKASPGSGVKADVVVAFPKEASRAKAMRAKDATYSSAVTCAGQEPVETPRRPIDG